MLLLALGLNHKTAPVAVREKLAIGPDEVQGALQQLKQGGIDEAAILSTCNRTELYCRVDPQLAHQPIEWLHQYRSLDHGSLNAFLYQHTNDDAVRHLLGVAAGLDSMMLGEPEILGQVKTAYRLAQEAETLDQVLDRLFQHTFACAKHVRHGTSIGEKPVSVAFAAATLAKQMFGDFRDKCILTIGAGETIELALRHARRNGNLGQVIIANRTLSRAQDLAQRLTGTAIGLDQLETYLPRADMIISSTGASYALVTRDAMQRAIRARKRKPVLIIDLAVPRDFEPTIGDMEDIYLYAVDDLQHIIEDSLNARREAAGEAEALIEVRVDQYMRWLKSRQNIELVRRFRSKSEATRDRILDKARREIESGQDPSQVVERLARRLTSKLIHAPSTALREAGEHNDERMLRAATKLLDIDE